MSAIPTACHDRSHVGLVRHNRAPHDADFEKPRKTMYYSKNAYNSKDSPFHSVFESTVFERAADGEISVNGHDYDDPNRGLISRISQRIPVSVSFHIISMRWRILIQQHWKTV
ncbi:hypothetical protein M514_02083 [Trichuris suis]|uniref:Uncharacterized protein n=1 Tax=Trichuris suis TaxID=68888 RepID=A0A085MJ02_9BILA|nr:hypothetical protein M513_02083 [Trichuris suis]KFD63359.1 hypothetical protein M514_02083 [Trichuris suis]